MRGSPPSKTGKEEILVLVKALPHAGERHGETVCCAGVTRNREWRRQFPVRFRSFSDDKKFKRWQWIEYSYRLPKDDRRKESRRIDESSIRVSSGIMRSSERSAFLRPLVLGSTVEAALLGNTLALIEPRDVKFFATRKSEEEIASETAKYKAAIQQLSFLDPSISEFKPAPFSFSFSYKTADGKPHKSTCDDWETTAMFRKFNRLYGTDGAISKMTEVFQEQYPQKGMAFAMGTHSRYPDIWLLVGVLRLDHLDQLPLI